MSKKPKKSEPVADAVITEVPTEEMISRFKAAQAISIEIEELEQDIQSRMSDKATLKEKLDKVSDDIKGKQSQLAELKNDHVKTIRGDATGRLPFGPAPAGLRIATLEELKLDATTVTNSYYPDLVAQIADGKTPAVNRAFLLKEGGPRYIAIPGPDAEEPHEYRLVSLHPKSWTAPDTATRDLGVTMKLVEFMDEEYRLGSVDDMYLVKVVADEEPPKKATAKGNKPGSSTRGAGVDRARDALGEAVADVLEKIHLNIDDAKDKSTADQAYDLICLAVMNVARRTVMGESDALTVSQISAMDLAALDQLREAVEAMALESAVEAVALLLPEGVKPPYIEEVARPADGPPKKKGKSKGTGKGQLPPNPFS